MNSNNCNFQKRFRARFRNKKFENLQMGNVKTVNEPVKSDLVVGRRIIDIQYVASQLFCLQCKEPIYLMDITNEARFGLASILFIECKNDKCLYPGFLNKIYTDSYILVKPYFFDHFAFISWFE